MPIEFDQSGDVVVAAVPMDELDAGNSAEFKREIAPVLDSTTKLALDLVACALWTAPDWAHSFPACES